MLSALDRKLLRDLRGMLGQAVMIALVVSAGVATWIESRTLLASLETTRDQFYERNNFADVFAKAKRAPNALSERVAELPGVARVETRIVEGVNLDVPGLDEPAVGTLISLPENREPVLNRVYLRRGRRLAPGRDDEVLASEKFVDANHLRVGDSVTAILNGRKKTLRIVGVVLSPEYVFMVKPGDLVPDPKRFGVFWMQEEALEMAFDMDGAFNDLAVGLAREADLEETLFRIDQLLEPYGGIGAYGRKDQLSHLLLTNDIDGLKVHGTVAPTIFLSVAAFLLNVVLSRVLALQREQIAALKAFGYSNVQIGWHYLKLVLLIILLGSAIGIPGGAFLARVFTQMIALVYQYPDLIIVLKPSVVATGVAAAGGAATLGAIGSIWQAVRVAPAEAMRPEPPASFKPSFFERIGMGAWVPNVARMIIRQLERRPARSVISVFAIALSVAIIIVGQFLQDAVDFTMEQQFFRVQRFDMMVATIEPDTPDILYELQHAPGVLRAEPLRTVSARLHNGQHERRVSLVGLPEGGQLFRLVDSSGAVYPPPTGGLMLSAKLARLLHVEAGGVVRVETLEGQRPDEDVPVISLIDDLQGLNAYTTLDGLNRFMGEGPRINAAYLQTDSELKLQTFRDLKDTPKVASVTVKRNALESFHDTVAKNLGTMKKINLFFACIIAVGVVYNSARIALSERSRELATLRVVGFTRGEISTILLGELGLLTLVALPFGWVMGYGFAWGLTAMVDQEVFRFPLVVERSTYGIATSVVLAASAASGLLVRRSLDHLDLIAVLKSRD
ncbi:FtsX-like permease family protein [Botrimarina colliarenosi]|uniref:FtsX-like permease family protein n=1 Tax=Botrimarina colliarenosi TaxID=2528001 RepID=A0A5C6A6W0_9BACT|nr:FtsX-like permease family protein [Botrimarina colliarenosi]TWT94811.1 FtsX-like permease family protein [Botrimarina colliarenosi]